MATPGCSELSHSSNKNQEQLDGTQARDAEVLVIADKGKAYFHGWGYDDRPNVFEKIRPEHMYKNAEKRKMQYNLSLHIEALKSGHMERLSRLGGQQHPDWSMLNILLGYFEITFRNAAVAVNKTDKRSELRREFAKILKEWEKYCISAHTWAKKDSDGEERRSNYWGLMLGEVGHYKDFVNYTSNTSPPQWKKRKTPERQHLAYFILELCKWNEYYNDAQGVVEKPWAITVVNFDTQPEVLLRRTDATTDKDSADGVHGLPASRSTPVPRSGRSGVTSWADSDGGSSSEATAIAPRQAGQTNQIRSERQARHHEFSRPSVPYGHYNSIRHDEDDVERTPHPRAHRRQHDKSRPWEGGRREKQQSRQ